MSTLYVLSLRTEEDLVETDGYVPGGLVSSEPPTQAGLWWAVRGPGSHEAVPTKGFQFRLSACGGGEGLVAGEGLPGGGAVFQSLWKPVFLSGLPPSAPPVAGPLRVQGIGVQAGGGGGKEGQGGTLGSVCPLSPSASGPSLTVSSLSPPAPGPPFSSLLPLVLLPCPLPVFWLCSGPSTRGGVRPCAHGTCPGQAPFLRPLALAAIFLSTSPSTSCPSCFSDSQLPTRLLPSELSPASPAGPARALGPLSSDSRP